MFIREDEKGIIKGIIKHVLGEIQYERMLKFFHNIITKAEKENYVLVFTTRRCQALFKMFYNNVFENDLKNTISEIIMVSDKYFGFRHHNLDDKKFLIIDDILIHGRTIKTVYDNIRESYSNAKIECVVYVKDQDATPKIEVLSKFTVEHNDWKELSNKIVAALILSSTPYTSYVYSFTRSMKEEEYDILIGRIKQKFEVSKLNLNLENTNFFECVRKNIEAYFVHLVNSKSSPYSYIRLYYNKLTQKCIIIPYVFLGNLDNDTINKMYDELIELSHTDMILQGEKIQAKYRAIVAARSLFCLNEIKSEIDIISDLKSNNPLWTIDKQYVDTSYEKDAFDRFFIKLICSVNEISKNANYHVTEKDRSENCCNVYYDVLNIYENRKNDNIENYFMSINEMEESKFEIYSKKKQKGIPISLLVNTLINNSDSDNEELLYHYHRKIIEAADTGLIAIYPECMTKNIDGKEKLFCEEFLTIGEQICRNFQNDYDNFICALYENKFRKEYLAKSQILDDKNKLFFELLCNCLEDSPLSDENTEKLLASLKVRLENYILYENIAKLNYKGINNPALSNLV